MRRADVPDVGREPLATLLPGGPAGRGGRGQCCSVGKWYPWSGLEVVGLCAEEGSSLDLPCPSYGPYQGAGSFMGSV